MDALIAALRQLPTSTADAAKLVATTCTYYDDRRPLMDDPRFRKEGSQSAAGSPRAPASGWSASARRDSACIGPHPAPKRSDPCAPPT